jgi:hypothetical protein
MAAGGAHQKNKKIKKIRRTRRKGEGERVADEWFSPEGCQSQSPLRSMLPVAALEHESARSCGGCGADASHGPRMKQVWQAVAD